jgi:hypothetical protein
MLDTARVGNACSQLMVFATGQSRFKMIQNISVERMQQAWEKNQRGAPIRRNFLRTNAGIEDESLLFL